MNKKILGILLCLLLFCSVLLLSACGENPDSPSTGGNCTKHIDNNEDEKCDVCGAYVPMDQDQGKDPGKDDPSNEPEDPDKEPEEQIEIDLSKISMENISISVKLYDGTSSVGYNADGVYLGMYTKGLFYADLLFEVAFEYGGKTVTTEGLSVFVPVTASSEVATADMTFAIGVYDLADAAEEYVSTNLSIKDPEDLVYDLFKKINSNVDYDTAESFCTKNRFTENSYEGLAADVSAMPIQLGAAKDYGIVPAEREAAEIKVEIGRETIINFNQYLPYSTFDVVDREIGSYYTDYENSEYTAKLFSFYLADNLSALDGLGLNTNEDGILVDEAFASVFDGDGITIDFTEEYGDGTTQKVSVKLLVNFEKSKIIYRLGLPSEIIAPLNFEEGATYKFDMDVNGVIVPVTHVSRDTIIRAGEFAEYVPEFLKTYGTLVSADVTSLTYKTPDSVTYVIESLPVDSRYEKIREYLAGGRVEFKYGDDVVVLTADSEGCCGVTFDAFISSFKEKASAWDMWNYLPTSGLAATDDYHEISSTASLTVSSESVDVLAKIKLKAAVCKATISGTPLVTATYYVGDEIKIADGVTVTLYKRSAFGSDEYVEDKTVPLTKDMFLGFDTSSAGDKLYTIVCEGLFVENCINRNYYVKVDTIVELIPDLGGFKYYVYGVDPDFAGFSLTAVYESGKRVEDIPVNDRNITGVPTALGYQMAEVTYNGFKIEVEVLVLAASKIEFVDKFAEYYVLGEQLSDVTVRVTFMKNDAGIVSDDIKLTPAQLSTFNTTTPGKKTWTLNYGPYASATVAYEVIIGAYLGYSVSTGAEGDYITVEGVFTDKATIDTDAYYEVSAIGNFVIPSEIGGIPVKKIAADAFWDTKLFVTVTIPASVKEIGESAFANISSLTKVVFEGSLTTLPDGCFRLCENLSSIVFPKDLKEIGFQCFSYTAIIDFVVPSGVVTLGEGFILNAKTERLAIPASASESFKNLGALNLSYLTSFAYDGSFRLNETNNTLRLTLENRLPASFSRMYVYDTDNFTTGLSYTTATAFEIYIDESVTNIKQGNIAVVETKGTVYYCAGAVSGISNSSGKELTKVDFEQWYEN